MNSTNILLEKCLYFTANSLARKITKMADEEFSTTGLSPSHAFVLMVVNENSEITPKDLALELKIAPSTITRFLDVLQNKGLIRRTIEGKISKITATQKGVDLKKNITDSWGRLYDRYVEVLGKVKSEKLTSDILTASNKLK